MHVAVAGVGGIGRHVLNGILESGKHAVTVLTRGDPKFDDHRIKWRKVDYDSHSSLVDALQDIDTCICTLSTFDDSFDNIQIALIQACIAAGVRRFVPSEFELDPWSRKDRFDYLSYKRKVLSFLADPSVKGKLESTVFTPGVFFDYFAPPREDGLGPASSQSLMSIDFDMVIKMQSCRASLVEGMEEKRIRMTAADDVGKVVARALELDKWPEQIRMSGDNVSCAELIKVAENAKGIPFEVEWTSKREQDQKYKEAVEANDVVQMFKWSMPTCVMEDEFGWPDNRERGVNMNNLFPDEKLVTLEEFLKKWWA